MHCFRFRFIHPPSHSHTPPLVFVHCSDMSDIEDDIDDQLLELAGATGGEKKKRRQHSSSSSGGNASGSKKRKAE